MIDTQITFYSLMQGLSSEDLTMMSAVLECLASESYRRVSPTVVETCLEGRYAQSSQMSEMIRVIIDNVSSTCAVPMSSPQGISRMPSMFLTRASARTRFPNCPTRTSSLWCTAAADGAVKRRQKSWSSRATRISWSSAGSLIGRARLSQVNNNTEE